MTHEILGSCRLIAVTGGRKYTEAETVRQTMNAVILLYAAKPLTIMHGTAKGADSLVDAWARRRGLGVSRYPADWNRYGKAAGGRRNQQMVEAGPDLLVAFPGGSGTRDMVRRCREAGIPIVEVRERYEVGIG